MTRTALALIGLCLLAGWPAAQRPVHTFTLNSDDFRLDGEPLRGSPALE